MNRANRPRLSRISGSSYASKLLGRAGDGSTLTLDFTTGQLDPRLTFTRASTVATFINASGLVATATTNEPRFDYDPTTLAPRGLLIEGTATNRALRSNDLNTTVTDGTQWSVSGYTRGDVSTTLPDGTTGNACRIFGTGSASFRSQSIAVTASTAYTFSFWARNNGGSQARYRVWNVTGGSSIVDYTLPGSNYVSQIGGANNTSTTWVRVSVTFTTPVGCTSIFVYPTSSDTGTVDVLLWGAQVEEGSGAPSSYIPTVASQVTRNPDYCSITSPNFASWYGSPTGWTVVAEMTPQSRAVGSFPGMIALRSAADSGLRMYYYNDGTYNTAFRFATASTNAEVFGPNGVTYGVPRKFGASVTSGTQFASSAGVQIGATQTLAVPMDQTLLAIGSDGVSPTPTVNCRMNFRSIKYWPYAMTLADLNARTA